MPPLLALGGCLGGLDVNGRSVDMYAVKAGVIAAHPSGIEAVGVALLGDGQRNKKGIVHPYGIGLYGIAHHRNSYVPHYQTVSDHRLCDAEGIAYQESVGLYLASQLLHTLVVDVHAKGKEHTACEAEE